MKATPIPFGKIINDMVEAETIGNYGDGSWCADIVEIHLDAEEWVNLQALAKKHPDLIVTDEELDEH